MKARLPIFSCAWLPWLLASYGLTQDSLPIAPDPSRQALTEPGRPAAADELLRRARVAVEEQPSIAAKVRHRVDLAGRTLIGSGRYLQQGRGVTRRLLLELTFQSGQQPMRWCQICDGVNYWILEELGEKHRLGWVDMARLARARPQTAPSPTLAVQAPSIGGLPGLLAGLGDSFSFDAVSESKLEDLQVLSVEGRWNSQRLARLLPDQTISDRAGDPIDYSRLSPNLPDRVVVHLGADDFFPYRVEYWRTEAGVAPSKDDSSSRLILLVEYFEVRLGGRIDASLFSFDPGKLQPLDRTQEYLNKLGLVDSAAAGATRRPPRR